MGASAFRGDRMLAEHLIIGQVAKAQGLSGEVKVRPLTDDPARFVDLEEALVERDGALVKVSLEYVRENQGFVYLRIDGAVTRDQAEAQRGLLLYVHRANAVKLPDDHHFIVDLIGCRVEDTSGQVLGTLTDVLQPGANDVYVVKRDDGNLLVPVLNKVVRSVDIINRLIVLDAQVLPEVSILEN